MYLIGIIMKGIHMVFGYLLDIILFSTLHQDTDISFTALLFD